MALNLMKVSRQTPSVNGAFLQTKMALVLFIHQNKLLYHNCVKNKRGDLRKRERGGQAIRAFPSNGGGNLDIEKTHSAHTA